MKGDPLPDADHVVRYVKHGSVDNGVVDASEFCLKEDRPGEKGVSVSWLEIFPTDKQGQLAEVRRLTRLIWKRSGRLAELNVGQTRAHLAEELPELSFIELPLKADAEYEVDPSHSEIRNLPSWTFPERSSLIGTMIAECIIDLHPAVV